MLGNRQGRILLGVLVIALAVACVAIIAAGSRQADAQMPTSLAEDAPAQGMEPAPPYPAHPGQREEPRPPLHSPVDPRYGAQPGYPTPTPVISSGGSAAVAASGDYVYVVKGNTLYQYSARSLKLLNKTSLPSTTPTGPIYYPSDK